MITGWLSPEDCPVCGGPLLDVSTNDRLLILACPGCGYQVTWQVADSDTTPELGGPAGAAATDPDDLEAE
jgi:hypothetical protein